MRADPARAWLVAAIAAGLLHTIPAAARTLTVGEGRQYKAPSAAARDAEDNDTILIEPGEYYDCAIWSANGLTVEGRGPGVVVTDSMCQGKALFIVSGRGTTIRNITLARARVPDGNGAGIRLEGQGLVLDRVRFKNDQAGLLGGAAGGAVRIIDCVFEGGGVPGTRPTYAVLLGDVDLLRIERSVFTGGKGGLVNTAAARTELLGNTMALGAEPEPGFAVLASDGRLDMQGNTIAVGPHAPPLAASVLADGLGVALRGNRLANTTGAGMVLLADWTGSAVMDGNVVAAGDDAVSSRGKWRHRASTAYYGIKDGLRHATGAVKRELVEWLR